MIDYGKYSKKAREKISQYGSVCEIRNSGKKVYNKELNTYEDTSESIKGYALQQKIDLANIDGTNIKFGDILLMCVFDERPNPNGTITFGGHTYTIINIESVNPNGMTDIYFKVHAR